MIFRALFLSLLFVLFGYRPRLGFERFEGRTMKIYIHLGKWGSVVEPISVVVGRVAYEVLAPETLRASHSQDAFYLAVIEMTIAKGSL